MLKKLLYFIMATAILPVVTCDIKCFLGKLNNTEYADWLNEFGRICENYTIQLKSLRADVKECAVNKISLNDMEDFLKVYCEPNSEMSYNFISQVQCFIPRYNSLDCKPKSNMAGEISLEELKKDCKDHLHIQKCIIDGAGKPCGVEDFAVPASKALESYYRGLCAEVGGAEKPYGVEDFAVPASKDLESYYRRLCAEGGAEKLYGVLDLAVPASKALEPYYKGLCAEVGGAVTNTVTVWSVLLCMGLSVLKWHRM